MTFSLPCCHKKPKAHFLSPRFSATVFKSAGSFSAVILLSSKKLMVIDNLAKLFNVGWSALDPTSTMISSNVYKICLFKFFNIFFQTPQICQKKQILYHLQHKVQAVASSSVLQIDIFHNIWHNFWIIVSLLFILIDLLKFFTQFCPRLQFMKWHISIFLHRCIVEFFFFF